MSHASYNLSSAHDMQSPNTHQDEVQNEDVEKNNQMEVEQQESAGKEQQKNWLLSLPLVVFSLTVLVFSAIVPHTLGMINAILYILLISLYGDFYFTNISQNNNTNSNNKNNNNIQKNNPCKSYMSTHRCARYSVHVLCLVGGTLNLLFLIISIIGLEANIFTENVLFSQNGVLISDSNSLIKLFQCPQNDNTCSLLCQNTSSIISNSTTDIANHNNDDGVQCFGNWRMGRGHLQVPTINATSMEAASVFLQTILRQSNIYVDNVSLLNTAQSTENAENAEVSKTPNTVLFLTGHAVSTFWGFVDDIAVLVLCDSEQSEHRLSKSGGNSDYEVWIVSKAKMGWGDFGVNQKRILLFTTNLQHEIITHPKKQSYTC